MRRTLIALVLSGVLTACGGDDDRPGESVVYERIESITDCAELQQEFDQSAAHNSRYDPGTDLFAVTLSYMEAANERMQDLGCP